MRMRAGLCLLVAVIATSCGEPTNTVDVGSAIDPVAGHPITAARHTVTVATYGNGDGTVSANPAVLSCPGACAVTAEHGSQVTLTAAPHPGSVFLGWSGAACGGTGPCALTLDADHNVTAVFGRNHSLVVIKTGGGTGSVVSSPAGIDCGADCSQVYAAGALVTLTATAGAESEFVGWSGGGCHGTGVCSVRVHSVALVEAQFAHRCRLTISRLGVGDGRVTSSPRGISCGNDCTESFACGTTVRLTAVAHRSTFAGWSNGCSGTGVCTVTLVNASTTIGAAFTVCGNGLLEPGEQCDDGNTINSDGCTNDCTARQRAATASSSRGEQCDDGNTINGDGCDNDCTLPRLRRRHRRTPASSATTATLVNGDGCTNDVHASTHVRRRRRRGRASSATTATPVNGDGCDSDCTLASVRRRHRRRRRAVRRRQHRSTATAARNDCKVAGVRRRHRQAGGEQCDDGNIVNGDGCSTRLQVARVRRRHRRPPASSATTATPVNGDGCSTTCTHRGAAATASSTPARSATTATRPTATAAQRCKLAERCGDGIVEPRRAVRRRQHRSAATAAHRLHASSSSAATASSTPASSATTARTTAGRAIPARQPVTSCPERLGARYGTATSPTDAGVSSSPMLLTIAWPSTPNP